MNKRLTDFYLPRVIHHWVDDERFPRTVHIKNFNRDDEGQQYEGMAETMNNNQQAVFQIITEAIERSPVTAHFFLEGARGTGKTYLYWALCSYYRSRLHRDQDNNKVQSLLCGINGHCGLASSRRPDGTLLFCSASGRYPGIKARSFF